MTTISVGDHFEQNWSLAVEGPLSGELDGLVNGDDVHTVYLRVKYVGERCRKDERKRTYLKTRDQVTTLEVLGVGGASCRRSTHTVLVVLANEDAREVPKLGLSDVKTLVIGSKRGIKQTDHIVRLEHLTLVACTVTVKSEGGGSLVHVLHREGDTGADGYLCTNDTVSTEE